MYQNRKSSLRVKRPVDYSDTKRRQVKTHREAVHPITGVEIKMERIEMLERSLIALNKRVGPEVISDDEDSVVVVPDPPLVSCVLGKFV